jgi:Domain of unknown function (DUF4375)
MAELKWLDGYSGQSAGELVALASEYRVDSIVLAFEQAILQTTDRDGLSRLTEAELTILTVESLEREVNNGGYHQFFLNTPEYAPYIVAALRRIGCLKTADISALAISLLGLQQPFTTDQVEAALDRDRDGKLIEVLIDRCDGPYFDSCEPIADRLFAYVSANRESIRLPHR